MVNVRNVFAFASVALVAAVSASEEQTHHRSLQAVNFREELLDAINAARKAKGLDKLCINEMLMDAAQVQANDMAENNFIKSTGSDGSLPKERAATQGFKAATVTEIVGAGYRTASSIVAAWSKASSAKNTLFSNSNVMGPGYTFDKTRKYVHFWAVDFSTGECGNGAATAGPEGSNSGEGSGSVELPSNGSGSEASGSVEAPKSGSGDAPAPASGSGGAPAHVSGSGGAPAPANRSDDDSDSGSGSETPAVTPAPAGSGAEPPAAAPAPADRRVGPPAAAPAPASSGAEPPASGSRDAASGSGVETPASRSDEEAPAATPAPAEATEAPPTDALDTPGQ